MEKLLNHTRYILIFIVVSTLAISYFHYSTLPGISELHNIFTELYYVPILLGALVFGLKGAILTYIFVTSLYMPYIFINWSGTYLVITNQLFHALFSGSFAVIAGVLADRERKRQEKEDKDHYLAGLGRAAAAIVHDLKNPIITIVGFSRRIMQGKGDLDVASQIVMDSAEKMQDIVHGVLDFAKPVKLDLKHEDICKIIRSACGLCSVSAQKTGVSILEYIPFEPVIIAVDGVHLERALVNLISNAVEASKEGATIIVSAETGDNRFCIKVKDGGEGMDKETLENIFIPFYTSKSTGTGIGMAIAKKIIGGHQGEINVVSQIGLGTEVTITLPL